jgi:cytochrome c553
MRLMTRWVGVLMAIGAAPLAVANGSVEAGATKAAVCVACHGPNGNSANEQWPSLAGQSPIYIVNQLKFFHDKTRIGGSSPVMQPMAATLSAQDMQDIAAYFAAQTPTGLEADPSYWRAGEDLYRSGDSARKVPACMACHGPVGRGMPASGYPALEAQHAVYIMAQLTQYANDTRYAKTPKGDSAGGSDAQIMHDIAGRLTPEEMRDVASYVQGLR